MNFEVNDVTAKILEEFQDTIDNALGDIKDKQDENMDVLKSIQDKVRDFDVQKDLKPLHEGIEENQEQIKILMEKLEALTKNINIVQSQLEINNDLLKRLALRSRRLR